MQACQCVCSAAGSTDVLDHFDRVVGLVGIDHVGIGSDLRGISRYVVGFDEEARFHAIASELLNREYSAADVGKVMGGNFFRVWQAVSAETAKSL